MVNEMPKNILPQIRVHSEFADSQENENFDLKEPKNLEKHESFQFNQKKKTALIYKNLLKLKQDSEKFTTLR